MVAIKRTMRICLVHAAVSGLCLFATPLAASTFTVTTTVDAPDASLADGVCADAAGDCTLRAAAQEANAAAGIDSIVLGPGTFTVSIPGAGEDAGVTGDIDVRESVTIEGAGADLTIVEGDPSLMDRLIDVRVVDGQRVEIRELTLAGGSLVESVPTDAGGVTLRFNGGDFELSDVVVRDAGASQWSAAVDVITGSATVRRSLFAQNIDSGAVLQAALQPSPGLPNVSFLVEDCTFDDNAAARNSGVLKLQRNSTPFVRRCVFRRNAETSILSNGPPLRVEATTIRDGVGPEAKGIHYLDGDLVFEVELTNCTISGFRSAGGSARGIKINQNGPPLHIRNCTITDCDVGLESVYPKPSTIANSIFSGSTTDIAGFFRQTMTSQGYNIIGTMTLVTLIGNTAADLMGVDPLLALLADNGGATPTHALLPGSPAIDGGNPAGCADVDGSVLESDQRGIRRPQDGDVDGVTRCDIGAFEVPMPCGADSDGDTVGDACDCAPSDATAARLPDEVHLDVERDAFGDALLTWSDEAGAGSGTRYEVASDSLAELWRVRVAEAPCVQTDIALLTFTDVAPPADNRAYYLVRAVNACGPIALAGWGADSFGVSRPACP